MGVGGAMVVGLPSLLAACGDSGSSGGNAATLRIGLTSEMDSLNPFVQQSAAAVIATHLLYPTLLRLEGDDFAVEPDLADDYEVAPDGRLITFTLKTTAKWSDGEPVTARDAAFTINMLVQHREGAAALLAQYVVGITEAEATDDETLVVRYSEPIANATGLLTRVVILPEHAWSEPASGDGAALKTVEFNEGTVCGGQFVLTKYTPKEIVLLEAHADWYGDKQSISTLGFVTFGAPDAMIKALESSEIDAVALLSPSTVGGSLDQLEGKGLTTDQAPGFVMNNVYFNVNPKKTQHRELLEPEVRRALSMGIDRERIVEVVLFGMGEPAGSLVYPAMGDWHDSSLVPDAFDVDGANEILDGLGFERGSDGIRMAGDEKMSYTVNLASGLAGGDRILQIISDGWTQLGVAVKPSTLDAAAMIDAISAPDGKYLTNDIAVWGFLPASPDPSAVLDHFITASIGGFNNCHYSDPEFDRMYDEQNATLDVDGRRRMVYDLQRRFFDARAMLALVYVNALAASGSKLTGYQMSGFGPFNAVSRDQVTQLRPA
ncbi:peptide ABC transporter substrate-binding protein [Nocardioides carbamazepini]|uniref:ABC transporter substrate-binding protein n=1 Tax=Nocardioides carbamazepini TaxID=2854259 RepID=UPI002149CCE0|nr:peptide ABC transporter substrate-binding protein [Nocardioides carbamazepini]MCR1781320.1 peptide ABC transporter substrate-binding protein [Nocardioides carbamazepini]